MRHVKHSCTKLMRTNSFCFFTWWVDVSVGIHFFDFRRLVHFCGSTHYFLKAFQSWQFPVTSEVREKRSLLISDSLGFLYGSRHNIVVRLDQRKANVLVILKVVAFINVRHVVCTSDGTLQFFVYAHANRQFGRFFVILVDIKVRWVKIRLSLIRGCCWIILS
jgi:hypothetical protein